MIGTFTTTRYDSRLDYERERPSGITVAHNRFTAIGMEWMWNMMAGYLRSSDGTLTDHLGSARIVVGNGDAPYAGEQERLQGDMTAQADLDNGYPVVRREQDAEGNWQGVIEMLATFGEDMGNFDWQERGVVTAQGVLLDRAVGDRGRKVLGAIWECRAVLRMGT